MRRDVIYGGLLWLVLTVICYSLISEFTLFPLTAAHEAETIDESFLFLIQLAIPVFTFVVSVLLYSIFRFRRTGEKSEDGLHIISNKPVTWMWLLITSGLAIYMIIDPGLTGFKKLTANKNVDLVVQVEARKWSWSFTYPQQGVTLIGADELILPVNQRILFEISSVDIIHSFWIPAFRMKIDAVPGQLTFMRVTPNIIGSFEDDINLRVQCAELCGTGHSRMRVDLRILTLQEFETWIIEQTTSTD